MALKENYKDDILDVSVNTKRKYRMTENPDGTISLEDETVYTQEGDSFGASDMNATNGKVNALESDIGEIDNDLTTLLNKVSYQSIDISTLTKYTDVEDLIMGSLADNKCPYIIAEVTQSSYIFHNMRLNFARSGYNSTNIFTFSNVIDHSSIWTVDISMTGTSIRVSSTATTFSNAKLYY